MIPGRNIIRKTFRHLCPITKVLFVSFVLFFSPFQSEGAVASDDFKTVDSETHRLFAEKKWDSVIIVGKRALRDNIDYFYLRLRIGISFFEIRKYLQAIDHLEKAHEFNSGDPMTMEYLYESYIMTGRNQEAKALAMKMPPRVTRKPTIRNDQLESPATVPVSMARMVMPSGSSQMPGLLTLPLTP